MRRTLSILILALLILPLAVADVAIEQHSSTKIGGQAGKLAGMFGGKKLEEGMTSSVYIKGDVMLSRTGDTGQRVDLANGTMAQIDYKKKRYKIISLAEQRAQMEQARAQLAASPFGGGGQPEPGAGGVEYDVHVDVQETGRTEMIGGAKCREVVMTVTAHPKGMTLEAGGGTVITTVLWLGPKRAEMDEWMAFQKRFATEMGLGDMLEGGGGQFASMLFANPAMKKALAAMRDKQEAFDGTAMRTDLKFETVRGTAEPAPAEGEGGGRSLGGMLRGLKGLRRGGGEAEASGPSRETTFESSSKTVTISGKVSDQDVALPAGFRARR